MCMYVYVYIYIYIYIYAYTDTNTLWTYDDRYKQGGRDGAVSCGRTDRGEPELPSFITTLKGLGSVWVVLGRGRLSVNGA